VSGPAAIPDAHATRRLHVLLAAVVLVLATPVVAWWTVGDLSESVDRTNADYVVHPLRIDPAIEASLDTTTSILGSASLLILVTGTRRRLIDHRWWGMLLPLVLVGACCGLAFRAMTAGVHGANIGAGMVVLVGPALILLALAWSAGTLLVILRSRARPEAARTRYAGDA
jgi:hypothetical protein